MANLTEKLKLHYTFGTETLNFTKDQYTIRNVVNGDYNGIISNPLCITSEGAFNSDMGFRINPNTKPIQLGKFILNNEAISTGLILSYWLNAFTNISDDAGKLFTNRILINANLEFRFYYENSTAYLKVVEQSTSNFFSLGNITRDQWIHIVFVHSLTTGSFSIYINTILVYDSEKNSNLVLKKMGYEQIRFGYSEDTDGDSKFGNFNFADIRLYDTEFSSNLISSLYNNKLGVKTVPYIDNFIISLVNNVVTTVDNGEIIFNSKFLRLPLMNELNLYIKSATSTTYQKINLLKDIMNNCKVLTSNLGNANTFSDLIGNIIYIPSKTDDNYININPTSNGLKILDLTQIDSTKMITIGNTDTICNQGYKFTKLNSNLISYIDPKLVSLVPNFINNLVDTNNMNLCSFDINNSIKYIYFYKFSNSTQIYYYLSNVFMNKINNYLLDKLSTGSYDIYTELLGNNRLPLISNKLTLIVANQQTELKISGPTNMNVNDVGSIKIIQKTPPPSSTLSVYIKLVSDTIYTEIKLTGDTYIFTPVKNGVYSLFAVRKAQNYNDAVSNTISISVDTPSQSVLQLSVDNLNVQYPSPINITAKQDNIPFDVIRKLYIKYETDIKPTELTMTSNLLSYNAQKLGNYEIYAVFSSQQYSSATSNKLVVKVNSGVQPAMTLSTDKSTINLNEQIGINVIHTDRIEGTKTIISLSYDNAPSNWIKIQEYTDKLPTSYIYYTPTSTGTVTIKVESTCNNYQTLIQNITFTVLKISQPLLNLDYDMLPVTYKKSLDKLELKLNYNSACYIYINNITFDSDIIVSINNTNCIIQTDMKLAIPIIKVTAQTIGNSILTIKKLGLTLYQDLTITIPITIIKNNQPPINLRINGLQDIQKYYNIVINRNQTYDLIVENQLENPSISYIVTETASIDSSNPTCKMNNNKLIPYNSGLCYIKAVLSSTEHYNESESNQISVRINKMDQPTLVLPKTDPLYYGTYKMLDISSNINLTSKSDSCTVLGNLVSGIKPGTCTITGTKEGDYMYNSTSTVINIPILKNNQPILNIMLDGIIKSTNEYNIFIDPSVDYKLLIPDLKDSVNANITFKLLNNSSNLPICTISGNILKTLGAGTCYIQATVSETPNYNSAISETLKININKKSQTSFSLGSMPSIYFGNTFTFNVGGGSNSNPINLFSDSSNCSVDQDQILGLNAGPCILRAQKDGDFMYEPISISGIVIDIKKKQQQLPVINIEGTTVDKNNKAILVVSNTTKRQLSVPNIVENATVTYTLDNNIFCKLEGDKLIALNEGVCILRAKTTATKNYLETDVTSVVITVVKQNQLDINILKNVNSINYLSSINLTISGGSIVSNSLLSSDSSNCDVSGMNVFGKKVGDCNITAVKQGDFMYSDISNSILLSVIQIPQPEMKILINNTSYPTNSLNLLVNTNSYTLSLSGQLENPTIVYNINNTNVCSINGNVLKIIGEGTCIIKAKTSVTNNYQSTDSLPFTITVNKNQRPDILIPNLPNIYYNNATLLDISSTTTNYQISTTSTNCSVSGNIIFGKDIGPCPINIKQPSDTNYYEKNNNFNLDVGKINQPPINIILQSKVPDTIQQIGLPNIFTSNNLTISNNVDVYKNGNYIISSSSAGTTNLPFNVFTNKTTSSLTKWQSAVNYKSDGTYLSKNNTKVNGQLLLGEWIQIQLPYKMKLTKYSLMTSSLKTFSLVGSIDGNIWYLIDSKNLTTKTSGTSADNYDILNNNMYFNYYRLITNKTFGDTSVMITQMNLLGDYTTFTYTLNVDRELKIPLSLQNLQDNAVYTYKLASSYSIDPANPVIKLENGVITPYSSGVCVLTAEINSTNKYLSASSIPIILSVVKAAQAAIIKTPIPPLYYKGTAKIDLDNVLLESKSLTNCTLSGNVVSGIKAGDCNLLATRPGDFMFNTQNLELNLQVLKLPQPKVKILLNNQTLSGDITLKVSDTTYNLSLSGQLENPNIQWNVITNYSVNPNEQVCSIVNNKLTAKYKGICMIQATLSETNNYLSSQSESLIINVVKNIQMPLSYNIKQLMYSDVANIDISGGSTLNSVQINVLPESANICSFNSTTKQLSALSTGSCKLQVIKPGDNVWDDAQLNIPLLINKKNQPELNINIKK